MAPKVLMVAEKPSIALAIASVLSGGRMSTRRGSTEVHEFDGTFLGFPVHYKVTSVIGHVFSVDFPPRYQDWNSTNPLDLFDAPVVKSETTPKAHICRHLSQEARGCGHLVLWLDCDREGENICFEVIECTGFQSKDGKRIYRARFSSVTEKDIQKAMNSLVEPNKNEALAVDARQEIDLKVGVAFTRFQTSYFNGKYGNLDSRVISYGPCQTPTLGFCVQRHLQITTFKPEKFWVLHPYILYKGYELKLDWERHRLFDFDLTQMFRNFVKEDGMLKVIGISEKQESKGRPSGLNTVNLLKVASSALGFGPQLAMQLAERLYTQGFISYPRTESTAYPSSFDYKGTLGALVRNPMWGNYVQHLLSDGFITPRSGSDAGDHPPITPMSSASEDTLGHDAWKLYQYICQHFLGTLSPDCRYTRVKIEFESGGELFHCVGQHVTVKGFTSIMPWLAVPEINIPQFTEGQKIDISTIEVDEGTTQPPDYLSESELISLMEKHGIGTDASIPVHINNICERNYVQVQAGRRLSPTSLGISLIRGYQCIDPDLCLPDIRSFIEQQIGLVAKGQADHGSIVKHVIEQFRRKFSYFVKQIENMDALFEAEFSPLSDSGRVLSKCGKCLRYMKHITYQPSRLYCRTCEEIYYTPPNGTVKCTGFQSKDGKRIYRARFSSVTEKDIQKAMNSLVEPNKNEALAVDARQEIDLKVGVAFTRFQTSYFNGKYGNLDSRVISYGPCQTPTLGFCVQRHLQITTFKPEKFWVLHPYILYKGYELKLDWERHRLFDFDLTQMFRNFVKEDGMLKVIGISEKQESKGRPSGLNTVNLLKVASSALGFGPQLAMQLAERLYTQGFISYPRTESTAYPSSFDYKGTLGALVRNPMWGNYVQHLLSDGFITPRSGSDAGDHPPITPMSSASEDTLGHDAWKLYQYICQHFLGTLSPDCRYTRVKIEFESGGELFHCVGQHVTVKGFTSIMPWLAVPEINIPQFTEGQKIDISTIEVDEGTTQPPDYLSESELISLMEKHGIGTDASIPVHINNICERNYVQVQAGRRLSPTSLGISLIRGYQCIDPDLCLPDIRSFIEQQIGLVAKGQADHGSIVKHVIEQFRRKFSYFVKQIENMDALFEAEFSPLSDSGRVLSKCGKCLRYMKHITYQPSRLYCRTCEEIYYTPPNGTVKLYKELTCPLDNFELLIFSMAGPDGKSFPFCPYCYNSPPFEGIENLFGATKTAGAVKSGKGAGMPCFLCPHPTCQHSMISQGVCACPECEGTLVLDPISAPRWRLYCNMCNCLVSLPEGAHRISTTRDHCPNCDSTIIEVDFNKKNTPLKDGATLHIGCILCDELLHSLVEMKHGKSFFRRRGGRGRGRGRRGYGGRGRGGRKQQDPKMSFRDF